MDICIFFPHASGKGGIETVLNKFLNIDYLKKQRIYIYISHTVDKEWLKYLPENVNVIDLGSSSNFLMMTIKQFIVLLRNNFDVVIDLGIKSLIIDYIVRKMFNKHYRIISWIHNSLHVMPVNNFFWRYADQYWAISSGIKEQLIQGGVDNKKIELIYNPVERNFPIVRQNDNVSHFVYLGRLENTQKNLFELIDGFTNLSVPYTLDIYGDGPDRKILREYAKQKKVMANFYGWKKNPWKDILLRGVDYLVLTSNYEGLPMVLLEAISRGIPVISSDCLTGPRDIINQDNGYLYPLHNTNQLKKIIRVASEKRNWSRDFIMKSIEDFYMDNYSKKIVLLLQQCENE